MSANTMYTQGWSEQCTNCEAIRFKVILPKHWDLAFTVQNEFCDHAGLAGAIYHTKTSNSKGCLAKMPWCSACKNKYANPKHKRAFRPHAGPPSTRLKSCYVLSYSSNHLLQVCMLKCMCVCACVRVCVYMCGSTNHSACTVHPPLINAIIQAGPPYLSWMLICTRLHATVAWRAQNGLTVFLVDELTAHNALAQHLYNLHA